MCDCKIKLFLNKQELLKLTNDEVFNHQKHLFEHLKMGRNKNVSLAKANAKLKKTIKHQKNNFEKYKKRNSTPEPAPKRFKHDRKEQRRYSYAINKETKNIKTILDKYKNEIKFKKLQKIYKKDKILESKQNSYYLELFKKKHNKNMKTLEKCDERALNNYLRMVACNLTVNGLDNFNQLNKCNIDGDRCTTKEGFIINATTSKKRNLKSYKNNLINLKEKELDLSSALVYFENESLKFWHYELYSKAKEKKKELFEMGIDSIYCEIRRNAIKGILLNVCETYNEDIEGVIICEPNICIDTAATAGDARNSHFCETNFRIPLIDNEFNHNEGQLLLLGRWYCSESDILYKKIHYDYFTNLINVLESDAHQIEGRPLTIYFSS